MNNFLVKYTQMEYLRYTYTKKNYLLFIAINWYELHYLENHQDFEIRPTRVESCTITY